MGLVDVFFSAGQSAGSNDWSIIYVRENVLKRRDIGKAPAEVLDDWLAPLRSKSRILGILEIRRSRFSRKIQASIYSLNPPKTLSERYNLLATLRTEYDNGEALVRQAERLLADADRLDRIASYRIERSLDDLLAVKMEVKNNMLAKPVLLLFSVPYSKAWQVQKPCYAPSLVDHEEELAVCEVLYDADADNAANVKEIFLKFEITRIPAWVLVLPLPKTAGGTRMIRFGDHIERFFMNQKSQGREMSVKRVDDVSEAFEDMISIGLAEMNDARSARSINLS